MKGDRANIKIVKLMYNAFMKQDIPAILELLSRDVEWGEPENPFNPAGGTRKGHTGFMEWINIGKEAEDILVLEPKQFLADNDTVVVAGYMKCLAKPTGKIYESDFIHLIKFQENKICKFREFFDTYIAGEAFRQN